MNTQMQKYCSADLLQLDSSNLVCSLPRVMLLLAITMFVAVPVNAQQDDLQAQWQDYIPNTAIGSIVLYPKYITEHPNMDLMPREIVTAAGLQYFGIDPLKCELVIGSVTKFDMASPPGFGFVLRFSETVVLSPEALLGFDLADLDGMDLYSAGSGGPSLLIVDGQTIMFGTEEYLKVLLDNPGSGDSKLARMMKNDPPIHAASLYFAFEEVRETVNGAVGMMGEVPEEFRQFAEIPNLVSAIQIHQQLENNLNSKLVVTANDSAAARKLEQVMKNGMEMLEQWVLEQMANEYDSNDPLQRSIIAYTKRAAGLIKRDIQPEINESRLEYNAAFGGAAVPVLVGMLLPAVQQAREAARRTDSKNRLRQVAIAAHNYHDVYKRMPNNSYDAEGRPLLSWRVHLLPYMEENALYEQFNLDEPWDSEHNIQLLPLMPQIYQSPGAPLGSGKTLYLGIGGQNTVFDADKKLTLESISNRSGASRTAFAVEVDLEMAADWTKPDDWTIDPNDVFRGLGGLRPAGFNVALCDASVHTISPQVMAPEDWKEMVLIDDE